MPDAAPVQPNKSGRLESIDVVRGLAALSVAIYHNGFGAALARATGQGGWGWIGWPGAHIAVPVFFVLSGFCIHLGWLDRKQDEGFTKAFFIQRFFRIYPAWLVAVLVSALALWLSGTTATVRELGAYLTLTNGFFDDYRLNEALWSVSVESFLYLVYPFWLAVRRRHGLVAACGMALAVNIASAAITARLFGAPKGPTAWFFLNVWSGWISGAVLAELLASPVRHLLRNPSWWLGGIIAWSLHLAAKSHLLYDGMLIYADLPVTIILCVWPVALFIRAGELIGTQPAGPLGWVWRTLAGIGLFSYSLYLLHLPLRTVRFLLNDQLDGPAAKGLLLAGWFGVTLLVSWLSYRWIEVPSARLGRRLSGRDRRPALSPTA